jgi:hypothetical protein
VADRKKKRLTDRRAAEGKGWVGWWAAGPKGKEVPPFLKLFSNQIFSIQIQTKPFKLFHRIL